VVDTVEEGKNAGEELLGRPLVVFVREALVGEQVTVVSRSF